MRKGLICIAMAVAMVVCASGAQAQGTLAYSYETVDGLGQPDGFFGAGATVTQDTIGATHGTHSMKYAVGVGGFVGARTETVIPAELNNPPGVKYVLFDLNVPEAFAGTFAVLGISGLGHELDSSTFGVQFQFADEENINLAPGQYNDLRIDLDTDLFSGLSFNDRFGDDLADLDVVSQFQFYMNKTVLNPFTVYIDNVRLVVPEPATFAMLSVGAVGLCFARRRRGC
jgi:hypothetical protein